MARNVTAIATGPGSVGVLTDTEIIAGAQSHSLDLKNTIAGGDEYDLRADSNETYGVAAKVTVSNSDFGTVHTEPAASIVDSGGNLKAPALFLDAAGGDYREAIGSPTVDAGVADPLIGDLDLTGSPRTLGTRPDIGAFELIPAPSHSVIGRIQSLAVAPLAFRPVNFGEAIVSAVSDVKGRGAAPISATVSYSLSAAASPVFTVERRIVGRRASRACAKKTKRNSRHKTCAFYRPLAGSFSHSGAAGANSFRFSGRLGGRALKPAIYRLTASVGGSSLSTPFKIAK